MKGRFIANNCNNVSIIQVTAPLIASLQESRFYTGDQQMLEYTIATDVPEEFKNGQPFYFNLEGSFNTYFHTDNCSWPKYSATISGVSWDDPCKD